MRANSRIGSQVSQQQGRENEAQAEVIYAKPLQENDLANPGTETFRFFPGPMFILRCIKTPKLGDQVGNCYMDLEHRGEI